MYTLIIISLIFFGLVFGSFGSVIFYRLGEWPTKETWKGFLVGRSECPKCHHQLKARNLVPIFSWLFQGGKCEYCKAPISRFYPFLEITSVIIFVGVFLIYSKFDWLSNYFIGDLYMGLKEGYIFTAVTIICIWLTRLILLYDIKTYELHITATVFLAIITLIFTLTFGTNKLEILLGIGIFTLIFVLIYYLGIFIATLKFGKKSEGFGLGDVIIAPILGAWLVFFKQPNGIFEWSYLIVFFIILSCIVGLFYSLLDFIIRKTFVEKKNKKTKRPGFLGNTGLPFLPSMIIATTLEIVFWEQLIYYGNFFEDWLINLLFL